MQLMKESFGATLRHLWETVHLTGREKIYVGEHTYDWFHKCAATEGIEDLLPFLEIDPEIVETQDEDGSWRSSITLGERIYS